MSKIQKGDVFRIQTNIGFGFLQFIELTQDKLYYIRVLDFISKEGTISQIGVDKAERWCTEFVLNIALHRKIVEKVDSFKIPRKFKVRKYARSKHIIGNEFLGWFIINRKSLKRRLKKKLSRRHIKLSPHGIMNDTYIIERLQESWTLENWK